MSQPRYNIVARPSEELVKQVLAKLRAEDRAELAVTSYFDTEEDLLQHIMQTLRDNPEEPFAATVLMTTEGVPLAIGGCIASPGTDTGVPWFLCTVDAQEYKSTLWRAIKEQHGKWCERYPNQWNVAWLGNLPHIMLIKRLGYTLAEICNHNGSIDFWRNDHVRTSRNPLGDPSDLNP